MVMILELTANGTDEWFRRYREKYQADAAAMHRVFFDAEYPISDIDPAKPGSDRTEVLVWPATAPSGDCRARVCTQAGNEPRPLGMRRVR